MDLLDVNVFEIAQFVLRTNKRAVQECFQFDNEELLNIKEYITNELTESK